jgi:anti-sigma B factor antagonist
MNTTTPMSETPLELEVIEADNAVRVIAHGEIDLSTAPLLKEQIETVCDSHLAGGTIEALQIDLRDVFFIDSAGLALLVEVRRQYMNRCRLALIISPQSQPARVLRLGCFEQFLTIVHSLEELT